MENKIRTYTVGEGDPLDFCTDVNEVFEYQIGKELLQLKCITSSGSCSGCKIHELLYDYAIENGMTIVEAADVCCINCTQGRSDTNIVRFIEVK